MPAKVDNPMKAIVLRIILFFLCIFMVSQFNLISAEASSSEKNVLLLQSYHRGHEWSDNQGNAIIETLVKSDMKLVPSIETMDWKRYPSEENLQQLYSRFKYKYSNKKIDLIITTDDAALKFALDHRAELFSNAPIVFGGVLRQDANLLLQGQENVTGAYEGMDPEGTIREAKKLIHGLKKIYIIHDLSESGISTGDLIKDAVKNVDDELMLVDLSNYSIEQIQVATQKLEKDSIIVLSSYNFDINQVFLPIPDFAYIISQKSAVPVFTIDEPTFGTGSIGGSLTSGMIHGKTVAEIGLRILNGEKADDIAIVDKKPVYWGFDYQALTRFNISLESLPENSKIINKPFSFYETYKTFVLSNIAIIVILFIFIIYLLININYRKKIEKTLSNQKEEIYHLAYYSPVTGLPNRINLRDRIDRFVQDDSDREEYFALIYIDIDNFKEVNDTFGHSVGDQVLRAFAERLREIKAIYNNAFSLGGDEFIVLIEKLEKNEVEKAVKDMFNKLAESFIIDNNTFYITVSGGIVFYPDHGNNYIELLKNSDTAMYCSKESGKGIYTYFDQSMSDDAVVKAKMQSNLRLAIDREDFLLYYQPQLDTKTGELWGYEALLRWNSPEFGFVQPLSFIKIAEDSRLIIPIGEWVLETACRFIKSVHDNFHIDCMISVNISVIQLLQDDFVDSVLRILAKTGLSSNYLELEITETVFLNSSNHVIEKLEKLKSAGIRVALDDFGTGYSSLSYLSQLPISTLKIDKTFIDSFFESNKNMVLTNTIIKMGHALGLELVVEGVETDEQKALFSQLGCDRIQGYQVGCPVSDQEIFQSLIKNKIE